MADRDWRGWHAGYDEPGSTLALRLAAVQQRIRTALDNAPPGALRAISVCAGQGRDLLEVLASHPRRGDVRARLVELNPDIANTARDAASEAGLAQVDVVTGDAALTDQYADLAPADLVLLCGIFGNISDQDIARTVQHCAALCVAGGTVIWTRHRRPPDLVPQLCAWFAEHGFRQEWISAPGMPYGVGVHRYAGAPRPLATGVRMFRFLPEKR